MEKIPEFFKRILGTRWIQEMLVLAFLFYLSILDDGFNIFSSRGVKDSFFLLILVYLHAQAYRFLVFPVFLRTGSWLRHLGLSFGWIVLFSVLTFLTDLVSKHLGWYDDMADNRLGLFCFYVLIYLLSSLFVFFTMLVFQFTKQAKKEKDYVLLLRQKELSLLKSQLRPHFLFNTLNNLYGISLQEPERVPDLLLKLSKIMRYQLEGIQREWVTVDEALDFFRAYISMETERVRNRCDVHFRVSILHEQSQAKKIAPMAFFSFVENAFKFGAAEIGHAEILLSIVVDTHSILFESKNKIPKDLSRIPSMGTGLEQARSYLQLVYPDTHRLEIITEEGIFWVQCELRL